MNETPLHRPPPRDAIEHRRAVAAAEAALFGGEPEPITVDRFELGPRIGAGGVGVVYTAHDRRLERTVAVKLVHPAHASVDEAQTRARWLAEARAMARLSHPNVVTVHEVGQDGPHVFIVMERVEGSTLRVWAADKSWEQILGAYESAGRGLWAAHEAGLVHRDFKPDNVLVADARPPRVLVTDFGIAAAATEGESAVEGTPAYMAPEQREGTATPSSDQFSFCVALYEALYGERPFPHDDPSKRIRTPKDREAIPTLLWTILKRGLSVDPAARWPSMEALLAALRPEPSPRYRWAAVVGILVLLAVLITGAVLQFRMYWRYQEQATDGAAVPWK